MANFTYICTLCMLESVHNVKIEERDAPGQECQVCGHNQLVRKLEAPAVSSTFTGSHKTEYSKTGPRK